MKPSKVTKEMDVDRVSSILMFFCFGFVYIHLLNN